MEFGYLGTPSVIRHSNLKAGASNGSLDWSPTRVHRLEISYNSNVVGEPPSTTAKPNTTKMRGGVGCTLGLANSVSPPSDN
jgi:hypothetical protein